MAFQCLDSTKMQFCKYVHDYGEFYDIPVIFRKVLFEDKDGG